jgi:GntR family transcriptional regulator/MocR family aminotransferase
MKDKKHPNGYKIIYNRYKQSILSGALKPSEKVPSIRILAAELGVAKRTVESAYDILIGEGYLITKGAKGTIVNPDLNIKPKIIKTSELKNEEDKDIESLISLRDNEGHFRLGVPSLDAFPIKTWLLVSGKAIRSMNASDMTLPHVAGYFPLRQAIANYVNISRGVDCDANQIFITSGYKNSIDLILKTLCSKKDKIVFEDPGYFFGQRLLKRAGFNLHYNPVDSSGLNYDYFKKHHLNAKFVIITPAHQSPLSVTLSLPRRNSLLNWAKQKKSWIIEDDYDGEFHYTKKQIPSLKSLDTNDRVIYVGTFSKTIMPSIRTSYIVMPKELITKFLQTSEITETGQALLPQKILANFMNEGHFFKHLKKMRVLYQKRREMVIKAIKKVFPDVFSFEITDGGMHIVAFLKKGTDDVKLSKSWHACGLQVIALSHWYSGKNKRYGLVIGFTNIKSEKEAVSLLQRLHS